MFATLVKKELLENIRNHRFTLALILCLVLIPLGLFIQEKEYEARDAAYRDAVQAYEENHKLLMNLIMDAAVFHPASPLSLVAAGMEAILPSSIETVGYVSDQGTVVRFNAGGSLGNPFRFLYGPLDLASIVAVILSILTVLFTFNAVAGEKERRTLSQVFANAVPRTTVVMAKMAAAILLLAVAFLAGLILGVIVLALRGFEIWGRAGVLAPFLLAAAMALLFIVVMVNLGLLVSVRAKSSLSAIITLVLGWVVLFMLVPKGGVIASKLLRPVKSQQVIDLEKNTRRQDLAKAMEAEFVNLRRTLPGVKDMSMSEFFKGRRANNPAVEEYIKKQKDVQETYLTRTAAEMEKIDASYEVQRAAQTRLARNISRLSPVSCFLHIVTETSRTGLAEVDRLKRNRASFRKFLDDEIGRKSTRVRFENMSTGGYTFDRQTPAPRIRYEEGTLAGILPGVGIDIALLFLYAILFFAAAYVSFLRYDLR